MKNYSKFLILAAACTILVGCKNDITNNLSDTLFTGEVEINHFPYNANGIKVEKITVTRQVEDIPGMTIVQTSFVNHGKTLEVRGYEVNRMSIKAQDTVVWSLQPSSSNARMDWVLPVAQGFQKDNYLGMNNSDYGGGIPMLDIWQRESAVAIGLTEPVLRMISMPVEWKRYDNQVTIALRYMYPEAFEWEAGDTITTYETFVYEHTGDFYNGLQAYSNYMQKYQGIEMKPSENEAFEPVWCAWGYERLFTIDEVIGTLDKVQELGFSWVDVDDGYQIAEGDWETNERFPGGDKDMRRLTDEIHKRGMKAKLWWAPLAADPGTACLKQHPERMLMTDEWGPQYITWWDSYYLSPVNPHTMAYSRDLVDRFFGIWGFDGLKIDGQHLNCCLPDYNEKSELEYPLQAVEQLPAYFEDVYNEAHKFNPNAVIQICPCGCAVNYFLIPTFNQAVASDPTCSKQVRMKRKAYAALAPQLAYYGDHVELTDNANDFASQIGVGAVIGTKFTYPKDNPFAVGSFLLTPEKEELIKHWIKIYKEKDLARGEYLNLYTWGFDYPEAHVIRQHDALYYAFYADQYEGTVELRGLDADKEYTVTEYTAAEPRSFTVCGSNPVIDVNFVRDYLIEVKAN